MGSDHRPLAYEAGALPLSNATETRQTVMDSNHRNARIKTWCLTTWRTAQKKPGEKTWRKIQDSNLWADEIGHGLANRSITTLAIFLICPVTSSGAAQSLRSISTRRFQQAPHFFFWMQRLDLNQRFLAYETSEDDRSSTLR
jgi:hypothetical protein